jgi:AAHS family 4-hydroxybenzoate transporter-like MFS transporter
MPSARWRNDDSSGKSSASSNLVDVAAVLDEGGWGGYQKLVVLMCALVIIIDGMDNQLLAIAIPAIIRDWRVPRGVFAPILASGFVGMMVGGAVSGAIGDRFGRRLALISSVLLFGLATIGAAIAPNLVVLRLLRFFAGFGLQGATPTAAALVSEFVPLRHRALAVTLIVVCFPLGATAAGLVAIPVLPALGWRALFVIGGVMATLVAFALIRYLPESPWYLSRQPNRGSEVRRVLGRMGHAVAADAVFVDASESFPSTFIKAVLSPALRFDSVALWSAFFFCLLAVYAGMSWVPSILAGAGLGITVASAGITAFNLGGVFGAIAGALAIGRFGSRRTMLAMVVGAVVSALMMRAMTITVGSGAVAIVVMLGITGGLINAVQTTMYALAAHVYPSAVRATGVGAASSVGRVGAILSSFAGEWALEGGGSQAFFGVLAAAMLMVGVSLGLIRRHIPGSTGWPRHELPRPVEMS